MAFKKRTKAKIAGILDITESFIMSLQSTTPKALPCSHTFSLECLEKNGDGKAPGNKIPCPFCKQKFTILVGGFEKLPEVPSSGHYLNNANYLTLLLHKHGRWSVGHLLQKKNLQSLPQQSPSTAST